jgi:hypothetical protein
VRFWKSRHVATTKVGIGVACFLPDASCREARALECLVASVRTQTWQNWFLDIVHDGPLAAGTGDFFGQWQADTRVRVVSTEKQLGKFGHPHRQGTTKRLVAEGAEWILHTNQDNYYAPVFLEWLLSQAQVDKTSFAYCDFVRSHKQWVAHKSRPRAGQLDLGAFIVTSQAACAVNFDKHTFNGDGDYINRLVAHCRNKVTYVPAVLMTHN